MPIALFLLACAQDLAETVMLKKESLVNSEALQKQMMYPMKSSFELVCRATDPAKDSSFMAEHASLRYDPINEKIYGYLHASDPEHNFNVVCETDFDAMQDKAQPNQFCSKGVNYCAGQITGLELDYADAFIQCGFALAFCPSPTIDDTSSSSSSIATKKSPRVCDPDIPTTQK